MLFVYYNSEQCMAHLTFSNGFKETHSTNNKEEQDMFEAGILGTLEDVGYSIRNNAFIAAHPEIWGSNKCRFAGDGSAVLRGVRTVRKDASTEKLLKEKEAQLASNENLTEEMKERILAFITSFCEILKNK